MVANELLEQLERVRLNFDWRYVGRSRKIRANLKSESVVFDPIGAVCYSKTGLVFDEEHWFRAAEELGLSHIDAGDLTAAANNVSPRFNEDYIHFLRRQIIDDVRLQPKRETARGFPIFNVLMSFVSTFFERRAISSQEGHPLAKSTWIPKVPH